MDGPLQQGETSKRLPVYTTEQRRPGEGNPNGDPQLWEQSYINCYPEVYHNVTTFYEREFAVIGRPGLAAGPVLANTIGSYGTIGTMTCFANIVVPQLTDVYVAAFFDSTASKIYILQYRPITGTTTKIGEITGTTSTDWLFITPIVQVSGGVNYPAVAISYTKGNMSTSKAWYAISSGGVFTAASLTLISSASYPGVAGLITTGPFQQIDGTSYIMTTGGVIYNSGGSAGTIYDITTWNTNGIVAASQYPDNGVGCYRFKNVLLAVMQDSIEFFVDAGVPPPASPLQRTDQAFIKFGCLSPKLITNIDDTIYWVAMGSNDTLGVWMLDGYTPTKISTPKIDYCIATNYNASVPINLNTLYSLNLNHKKHLLCNFGGVGYYNTGFYDSGTIFQVTDSFSVIPTKECGTGIVCYNVEDKIWWGLAVIDGNGTQALIHPATYFPTGSGEAVYDQFVFCTGSSLSHVSSTLLFKFSNIGADGSYNDAFTASNPVCCSVQFNTYWFGTEKKKRIDKAKAIVNRISQVSGDANNYFMYICYTKDDTTVTSGPQFGRQVALPGVNNRYYISQLGTARNISFLIVCKSVSAFRCLGLELDLVPYTS